MDLRPDELAGVVDMFGALTAEELQEALAELAFKQGEEYAPDSFAGDIERATEGYHLVAVDPDAASGDRSSGDDEIDELLVAGPVAFPELPENAEDLAHIMDVTARSVDRETAGEAAVERFRREVDAAERDERVSTLVDVSYELEAWASVDLSDARERLDQK